MRQLPLPSTRPPLLLVLVSPQIPPNTGNVARLCACTGCQLALIEPLGFSMSDRHLRRAGLDYWNKVFVKLYASWNAYLVETPNTQRWLLSSHANTTLWATHFSPGDHLVFGAEDKGLPPEVLASGAGKAVTIPMLENRRSLNLSTAAAIATYEALRQFHGVHAICKR